MVGRTDATQHVGDLAGRHHLGGHSFQHVGPMVLDQLDAGGRLRDGHVLVPRLGQRRVADRRDRLQSCHPLIVLLGRQPFGGTLCGVDRCHVEIGQQIVDGRRCHRAKPHLVAVAQRGFPVQAVPLHLPLMREVVASTRGRTRRLHRLHRQARQDEFLGEPADGLRVAGRQPLRIVEGIHQRRLHQVPDVLAHRFAAQLVGDQPVGTRRDLLDQVAVTDGGQPLRGSGHDVEVGDQRRRRGAVPGDLEPVAGDRGAIGGIAVHGGCGADVHVPTTQLAGGELRDVVQSASSD